MFIVNAPFLFSGVWAIIKPWLDKKTRDKISIHGSGFQKELLQLVDKENLPEFLGGECKCSESGGCLLMNPGLYNPNNERQLFYSFFYSYILGCLAFLIMKLILENKNY